MQCTCSTAKLSQQKGKMKAAHILKRNQDGGFSWLESAASLESAKSRLHGRAAPTRGEFFVFDQVSQQIVANSAEIRGKN